MSDAANRFRKAAVEGVLTVPAHATAQARQAAFDNEGVSEAARALIDKVTRNAWKVGDQDVAAAKEAGLSEDEIFELAVCAALGQSTRQLESALAALEGAFAAGALAAGGRKP